MPPALSTYDRDRMLMLREALNIAHHDGRHAHAQITTSDGGKLHDGPVLAWAYDPADTDTYGFVTLADGDGRLTAGLSRVRTHSVWSCREDCLADASPAAPAASTPPSSPKDWDEALGEVMRDLTAQPCAAQYTPALKLAAQAVGLAYDHTLQTARAALESRLPDMSADAWGMAEGKLRATVTGLLSQEINRALSAAARRSFPADAPTVTGVRP